MIAWIISNLATIIISAVLIIVVAVVIAGMVEQEKGKIFLWLRVRGLCHER